MLQPQDASAAVARIVGGNLLRERNVGKVPRRTSSSSTQRKALFLEPATRGSRREGVRRAQSCRCCETHR